MNFAIIKDNVVINIAVFQEHDHDSSLLNDVMGTIQNAVKVICCCTFGRGEISQSWDEDTSSWVPLPIAEFFNENA